MLIVAGLGNPGNKYANNRHNIGFMAVDEIARRHQFSPWKNKHQSLVAEGRIDGAKALLIKPQTMMNNSGQAIGEAMRYFNRTPDDILVIYDELDLAPAKVRFKTGGGAGGHNGLKSIIEHCGEGFHRLRMGIGRPDNKAKVIKHVLGDFSGTDKQWLEPLLKAVGENADMLASAQYSSFMNRIALVVQQANKPEPETTARKKQPAPLRQSRPDKDQIKTGPMADMLKKLFGSQ